MAGASDALGQTYYVRSGASGSGSDWANAYGSLPTTLVRGATYYIADGTYSGRTFNTAASGTTLITIKKATVADHGTNTGWDNTYGDGQAVFNGGIAFDSSYWVFDGQTGGGPGSWNTGFGFKVYETGSATPCFRIGYAAPANNITIRHVEMQGMGSASGSGGCISNFGLGVYKCSNITLSYAWMYGIGNCPFFLNAANSVFEYVYVQSYYGSSAAHSEVASIWDFGCGSGNTRIGDLTFRYNLIAQISSTGGFMWDNVGNPSCKLYIYGNVFYKPASVTWEVANGLIGGWTGGGGEQMHNVWVFNNTFINVNQKSLSDLPQTFSGCRAQNNLWYNCNAPTFSRFPTHDYNHFINSGSTQSEANGTSASSGDPFVNFASLNFELKANTSPGMDLGSPFNIDPNGRVRTTWSRGAFEFGNANTNPVISVSPASLDFGSVLTNTFRDLSFTVQNTGGGTLSGTATVSSPFSIVSCGTYSLTAGQSQTVTVRYSANSPGSASQTATFTGGGGASRTVSGLALAAAPVGMSFEHYAGVITSPFSTNGGAYLSQAVQTGVADGGRAVYTFTVPEAGSYVIRALVNAPSLTENSFFVNVDAEPQDPTMAWDILPPTSGFEQRFIGRRGNGTGDWNQFDRQVFNLTAGTHQLIVVGREPNTQLSSLAIFELPPAPQNVHVVFGQ